MPSSSRPLDGQLRGRLIAVTAVRSAVATLLLVGMPVLSSLGKLPDGPLRQSTWFVVVGVVYGFILTSAILLRFGQSVAATAWFQVLGDLAFAGTVVYLTDTIFSPFWFALLLAILEGALLLGRRGALGAAGIAILVTIGLAGFAVAAQRAAPAVLLEAAIQVLAQVLVGTLSGSLAEQLARTRGRLDASIVDLERVSLLKERIIASIPSGVLATDATGAISFMNPAGRDILGLEPASSLPALSQLFPGLDPAALGLRNEVSVETPRGRLLLGVGLSRLDDSGARLAVFQDLTEVRRREAELSRLNQLADLGRLSAVLAHEVRNPLASMRGSAQLMLAEAVAGSANERLCRIIVREADRLAELVEQHLQLARLPPPERRPIRFDEVARETVEMLSVDPSLNGVRIETDLSPTRAEADPAQLKQALLNLLRNASAAVGRAGRVRISTRATPGAAIVEVWDSAGAIPDSEKGRLFEPFFSRSGVGTGLGLSTVQSIVHAHGGRVGVESSPAQGTTLTLTFPRSDEEKS